MKAQAWKWRVMAAVAGCVLLAAVGRAQVEGERPVVTSYQPQLELQGLPEQPTGRFIERIPEATELVRQMAEVSDGMTTAGFQNLSLRQCLDLAIEENLALQNAERDVELAQSRLRESEAFFIPFVELIGDATYSESRVEVEDPITGEEERQRITENQQGGRAEVTQNLTTGGQVRAGAGSTRTRSIPGTGPDGGTVIYETDADIRMDQPLLRGAGFDVATAALRKSRLSRMNQEITYRLEIRDTLLRVVQQYFALLQAAQEIGVSESALAEKLRFLEETRIRYDKGRVAESEILRAELQYLQEQENALRRQQVYDDRRERLALTLGLDPSTPLTVIDVSQTLSMRGRYVLPPVDQAVAVGLNSRLELLQNEIAYEQQRIDVTVARNNVLPNLDLTGGYETNDADAPNWGSSTDLEDNTWDVGVELRVPIPNIGRREQRKRAEIELQKIQTAWVDLERQIEQEITSAHRAVETSETGLAILAKTVEQAQKNLELINGSFEVGYSTITEVRLAQDDLFDAQTRYNNTLLNYQIAIAQYYVAVGQTLY